MSEPRATLSEINNIFMQFGQNLGLGNLSLDGDGLLSLVFDDHLVVEVQMSVETGVIFLIAPLSATPDLEGEARIAFQNKMLEAPLNEGNLAGSFFCVDPESEEILLIRALDAQTLSRESLENDMERFVNALEHWSSKMEKGTLSFDASPSVSSGGDEGDPSIKGAVQI